MTALHDDHIKNLNSDQLNAYKTIYSAIDNGLGNMYFVNGYGGTGKTFLWKTLTYKLRSEGKIVLNHYKKICTLRHFYCDTLNITVAM
jgi:ATP-dependent DNA helicase PIF1